MDRACRCLSFISQKSKGLISWSMVFLFIPITSIVATGLIGCATKPMTLDEAKQTAISLRGKSFVPPPRNIDDILSVITKENEKNAMYLKEWENRAKIELPVNASKNELIEFYSKRGDAGIIFGSFEQSREDLKKAYEMVGPKNANDRLISNLAALEFYFHNYEKASNLYNLMKERRIYGFHPYAQLASIYAITGEFEKAEAIRDEGMLFPTRSYSLAPEDELQKARLEYIVLNMKAKYKDAEPFIRKAIFAATHHRQDMPHLVLEARIALIRNLANQNRFVEAEIEARQVVDKFSLVYGEKSTKQIYAMMILSEVLLAQDRLIDAEKVCQASLKAYEQLSISPTLHYYLHSLNTLGKILMAKGDYSGAMMKYDLVLGMKDSNRYIYNNYYRRNHNVMLALIMTERSAEAMELIESSYQDSKKLLGEKHSSSAGLLALRGMANNALGNLSSAYHDFAEAIPLIAKSKTYAENRLFNHRFTLIMESFLDLLTKLRGSPVEARLSISASAQAFETSTLLSDSAVQAAILASSSRMTIEDPALQELARTEQDLQQQITAYQNLIRDNLARPLGDSDRQGINNLKTMLDKAAGAREIIVEEIHKRFPNYANLIDPRQPSLVDVQSRLKPAEVIISICSAENSTYVFAITLSGPPEMFSVPVTRKKLDHLVSELKNSLYPGSDMLKQLPAYNFAKAYELYSLLLKPVEAVWKNSKHLILTASGPLSQLPFALLTTEPFQLSEEKEVLFSSYRNAPWLINQIFMTRVPSVSSFVALRERPGTVHAKRPFAGFGDPIFNQIQLAQASNETKLYGSMATTDKGKLDIRGIRLTNDGSLDNQKLTSCTLEMLERLPDTADELISIAEALGANPVQDVYLGPRASENQVKSIDLSDRRVVAFASHALVPYDLNGLDQPAIALSAPSVTGDEGDGLLTMAEILDLKLNADWVVLSACNTGAADGAGAEAVSGLGRAFFYAGTRSLLVSMWPVETTSAKKLTTSLFRHLKDNPGLTKAQAHQRAMLELIDGPGMIDEDGRTIASYAHPFFWAPFIVVGDNGMGHLN